MSALDAARADLRAQQGRGARYDASGAPARGLELARLAAAYFARRLGALGDADLAAPSTRAGWSRARVVASVALQARALAEAIEGAGRDVGRDVGGHAGGQGPGAGADTGPAALDLAETLPPHALRHLAAHAGIHLDVAWRDLPDAAWSGRVRMPGGAVPTRETPRRHALAVWGGALALGNGGRLRDVPADLRQALEEQD